MAAIRRVFQVDGRPFFPLGGQARSSSGYSRAEAERAFQAVVQLHGNTLELPVYWEQVEPEEALDISETRPWLLPRQSHYLSVDEGLVTDEGAFVVRRRRNGDETDSGVWVEPDVGVVRVVMCE